MPSLGQLTLTLTSDLVSRIGIDLCISFVFFDVRITNLVVALSWDGRMSVTIFGSL